MKKKNNSKNSEINGLNGALHEVMEVDVGYLFLSGPWPSITFFIKRKQLWIRYWEIFYD
ncbi:hypothetical protein [Psychromonas ingrahamii]|uniref:hypothetical protein n=1 Tax=Psychromonas ingrahamii TaxID=357794 RepID=UPI0012EDD9E5|nr:hypothetical protein [Psychromonas ingrahamii]